MDVDQHTRRAQSFERGAAEYERLRPPFPAELFAAVQEAAGERLQGRVLEIGAGTGRATLPLARLRARIEAIDPSADMLRVLAARLDEEHLGERVSLREARFEDIGDDESYDVVVAAQLFHWADPRARWSRLADLIRPDGRAFLFWNGWSLDPEHHDVDRVAEDYRTLGRDLAPDISDHRSTASWAERELADAPGLTLASTDHHHWPWTLPTDDYLALLSTTSQYAVADAAVRERLFAALRTSLGGAVVLDGRTLCLTVAP